MLYSFRPVTKATTCVPPCHLRLIKFSFIRTTFVQRNDMNTLVFKASFRRKTDQRIHQCQIHGVYRKHPVVWTSHLNESCSWVSCTPALSVWSHSSLLNWPASSPIRGRRQRWYPYDQPVSVRKKKGTMSLSGFLSISRCRVILDGVNYTDFISYMSIHMICLRLWGLLFSKVFYPSHPVTPVEPSPQKYEYKIELPFWIMKENQR